MADPGLALEGKVPSLYGLPRPPHELLLRRTRPREARRAPRLEALGRRRLALFVTGLVVYVPLDKARTEEKAHHAPRGPRQGVLVPLSIEDKPHTLELTWSRDRFAPVLEPAPAPGTTLEISGRFGEETLTWNTELGAFGPTAAEIDPYGHYKVSLRLEREGRTLWRDTLWAYGIHDTHGHAH